MVIYRHTYNPDLWVMTKPAEEWVGTAAKVTSDIQLLYDAGTPLFTKDAIQDVLQQLESSAKRVWIKGLNGVMTEFDIESGRVMELPKQDLEYILYVSIN
jgi:hypothetical protein